MNNNQLQKYIHYLYQGDIKQARKYIIENINTNLYRYEKVTDSRLKTLENSQIFLSEPSNFDDAFDTKGIYYTDEFISSFYKKAPNPQGSLEDFKYTFEELLNCYYSHCGITCFSEDLNNFPMWWHYADERTGFCVEYDLSEHKNSSSDDLNNFHPILYAPEKFNFENLLRPLLEQIFDDEPKSIPAQVIFHYFLGTIKHESWSYQKEWRYIVPCKYKAFDFPIKVSAIYLGDRFLDENLPRMKAISEKLNCALYKMALPKHNQKAYSFIPVKIE